MAADPARFVNPYAFVPLPNPNPVGSPAPFRKPAPTHAPKGARAGELLCGTITVSWTLQTPMLLPADFESSGCMDASGHVVLPGSSIKGATRSLHEAMFNGCLRVLDQDFTPGYRDAANSTGDRADATKEDWRIALVTETDKTGKPVAVRLCTDEVWLDSGELRRAYGGTTLPRTGDVISLDTTGARPTTLGRTELRTVGTVRVNHRRSEAAPPDAVTGRVFIATDTGTRRRWRRDRQGGQVHGRCFWASGELDASTAPTRIPPGVAEAFKASVESAEDRRILRSALDSGKDDSWTRGAVFTVVEWWLPNGQFGPVASRTQHSGLLWPGDVVWACVGTSGEITALRLSQIWRHAGKESVKARMPKDLAPCNPADGRGLCLTCSIFGAIDDTGTSKGTGAQDAYAAHVRFGSARTTEPVTSHLRTVQLTPLGAPKPGAGMFYLRNERAPGKNRRRGDKAAEWGSDIEPDGKRPIAGRKFYWHSNPDQQAAHWSSVTNRRTAPRYEAVGKQRTSDMSQMRTLVPAGTVLEGSVTFDGLDELSLRTLVWALDPSPILRLAPGQNGSTFAVHLGGGKPLGLGSAVPALTAHASSRSTRYLGTRPTVDLDLTKARAGERTGDFLKAIPYLSRMLDLNGLGDDELVVSYPPAVSWLRSDSEEFRKSYEFFVAADGERLADRVNPWHPLASPAPGVDVTLPIDPGEPT